MATIQVTGQNPIEEQNKVNALQKIEKLSTKAIQRLAELAQNPKAVAYFENDTKFTLLKKLL